MALTSTYTISLVAVFSIVICRICHSSCNQTEFYALKYFALINSCNITTYTFILTPPPRFEEYVCHILSINAITKTPSLHLKYIHNCQTLSWEWVPSGYFVLDQHRKMQYVIVGITHWFLFYQLTARHLNFHVYNFESIVNDKNIYEQI